MPQSDSETAVNHMQRGLLWLGSTHLIAQFIDALSIIIILNFLNREQMGLATLAWTVAVMLEGLNGLGVATALVQIPKPTHRQLSSLFFYSSGIGCILFGVSAISSPLIAAYYGNGSLQPMILVSGIKLLFVGTALVPLQLMSKRLEFEKLGAVNAVATLGAVTLKIGLAVAGYGAWALVVGSTAHGLLVWIIVNILGPFRPALCLSFPEISGHIRFGLQASVSGVLYHFYRNIDYLLLGKFASVQVVGLYRAAFDIAMSPATALLNVVSRSAFPVLSTLTEDRKSMTQTFLWTTRGLSLLVAPLSVVFLFVADDLLLLFARPDWQDAANAIRLLAVAAFLRSLAQLFPQLFHACGKPKLAIYDSVLSLAVITGALCFFLSYYGQSLAELAACLAWLSAYPILIVFLWIFARQLIPLRAKDYFATFKQPLQLVWILGIALLVASLLLHDVQVPPLRLCVYAGTIVFVYGFFFRYILKVRWRDILLKRKPREYTAA